MMSTNLSRFVKGERLKQGLNYVELAKKMNYTNINRGMRRIIDFERDGVVHPDVLSRIVSALELDRDHINALIKKDRQEREDEFEIWVSEPIRPYYILRIMPTIYPSYDIPINIPTEEQIIEYVCAIAKEQQKKALLRLSRRENISINEQGEVTGKFLTTMDNAHYPYTRIK